MTGGEQISRQILRTIYILFRADQKSERRNLWTMRSIEPPPTPPPSQPRSPHSHACSPHPCSRRLPRAARARLVCALAALARVGVGYRLLSKRCVPPLPACSRRPPRAALTRARVDFRVLPVLASSVLSPPSPVPELAAVCRGRSGCLVAGHLRAQW